MTQPDEAPTTALPAWKMQELANLAWFASAALDRLQRSRGQQRRPAERDVQAARDALGNEGEPIPQAMDTATFDQLSRVPSESERRADVISMRTVDSTRSDWAVRGYVPEVGNIGVQWLSSREMAQAVRDRVLTAPTGDLAIWAVRPERTKDPTQDARQFRRAQWRAEYPGMVGSMQPGDPVHEAVVRGLLTNSDQNLVAAIHQRFPNVQQPDPAGQQPSPAAQPVPPAAPDTRMSPDELVGWYPPPRRGIGDRLNPQVGAELDPVLRMGIPYLDVRNADHRRTAVELWGRSADTDWQLHQRFPGLDRAMRIHQQRYQQQQASAGDAQQAAVPAETPAQQAAAPAADTQQQKPDPWAAFVEAAEQQRETHGAESRQGQAAVANLATTNPVDAASGRQPQPAAAGASSPQQQRSAAPQQQRPQPQRQQ